MGQRDGAKLAGVIAAEADPPGIDPERYHRLIAEHPALASDEGESTQIVDGGAVVGRLRWSQWGAREIDVHGEVDRVQRIASELARALDARFVPLSELTSC